MCDEWELTLQPRLRSADYMMAMRMPLAEMSEEPNAWLQAYVQSCDALPACAFQLVLGTNKTVVCMTENPMGGYKGIQRFMLGRQHRPSLVCSFH